MTCKDKTPKKSLLTSIFGVWFFFQGILACVGLAFLYRMADSRTELGWLDHFGVVFLCFIGAVQIAVGVGLMRRLHWARIVAIVLSALCLPQIAWRALCLSGLLGGLVEFVAGLGGIVIVPPGADNWAAIGKSALMPVCILVGLYLKEVRDEFAAFYEVRGE